MKKIIQFLRAVFSKASYKHDWDIRNPRSIIGQFQSNDEIIGEREYTMFQCKRCGKLIYKDRDEMKSLSKKEAYGCRKRS